MQKTEAEKKHDYYVANKEKWTAYRKKWRAIPENREKLKFYSRNARIENPEKFKERDRLSKLKHREKYNARSRNYNKAHAKEIKAYQDGWREANKEWFKQWRLDNPHRCKAYKLKRRTLESSLRSNAIKQVYENNIMKYGTLACCLCDKKIINGDDTLEHLTPLCRGGNNEIENLGIAHKICNFRKATKTLSEWNLYKAIYASD